VVIVNVRKGAKLEKFKSMKLGVAKRVDCSNQYPPGAVQENEQEASAHGSALAEEKQVPGSRRKAIVATETKAPYSKTHTFQRRRGTPVVAPGGLSGLVLFSANHHRWAATQITKSPKGHTKVQVLRGMCPEFDANTFGALWNKGAGLERTQT